jgi:hypothetical protein
MHFDIKNYLKNTHNHTTKHALSTIDFQNYYCEQLRM